MHETHRNAFSALMLQIADATDEAIRDAVDLSGRELAALVLVRNRPGCNVNWLHARLGLTQSGAVRLLDRLQSVGLIERTRTAGHREVRLTATAPGDRVVAQGTAARAHAIDRRLAGLGPVERDTFLALAARALARQSRSRDEGDEACRLCDWRVCTPDCPMDDAVGAPDERRMHSPAGA